MVSIVSFVIILGFPLWFSFGIGSQFIHRLRSKPTRNKPTKAPDNMNKLFDILTAIVISALAFWFLCYGLDVLTF